MIEVQGSLMIEGEVRIAKRRHLGVIKIDDDKFTFVFKNGNTTEIKIEEIKSIIYYDKIPKNQKRPLITLKNGRNFVFSAVPKSRWNVKGQLSGFVPGLNTIKSHYEMSEMNQQVYNVLNYLLKASQFLYIF